MQTENKPEPDICSTIQSAENLDPFEGINLKEVCISPDLINKTVYTSDDTSKVLKSSPEQDDIDEPLKGSTGEKAVNELLFDLDHQASLSSLDTLDFIDQDDLVNAINTNDASKSISSKQSKSEDDKGFILIPDKAPPQPNTGNNKFNRTNRQLSKEIAHPPVKQNKPTIHPLIEKAYHYAELTQIREKIFSSLDESDGNSLLIASPNDNTGSSFLAAALGYNAARSHRKKVLLIDTNMRRAGLHNFFGIPQLYGLTDIIRNNIPWQVVVKDTGIEDLSIITAGHPCENFSEYIRYSHIPNLHQEVRSFFDLIIFDASPVLAPNRNNIDIVSLTSVVDYFLLVTKQSGTTKEDLKNTKNAIEAGNGTIHGIVINEHSPEKKSNPFSN